MSNDNIVKKNKNIVMFYFMIEKLFKFKILFVKFWIGIVCSCDIYILI